MLTKSLPQVILESHFDMWEFGGNFHDDACCILSFSFVFILFSVVIFFFTWWEATQKGGFCDRMSGVLRWFHRLMTDYRTCQMWSTTISSLIHLPNFTMPFLLLHPILTLHPSHQPTHVFFCRSLRPIRRRETRHKVPRITKEEQAYVEKKKTCHFSWCWCWRRQMLVHLLRTERLGSYRLPTDLHWRASQS